jgi:hypothetical protein
VTTSEGFQGWALVMWACLHVRNSPDVGTRVRNVTLYHTIEEGYEDRRALQYKESDWGYPRKECHKNKVDLGWSLQALRIIFYYRGYDNCIIKSIQGPTRPT